MVLTDKQKHELHLAIFDYLSSESHGGLFSNTVAAFQQDSGVTPEILASASGKGMLEKKWTSVIRLQKKVREEQIRQGREGRGCLYLTTNHHHITHL
jgi:platelet-activating factor acetylhydrolase IB subunit alpha